MRFCFILTGLLCAVAGYSQPLNPSVPAVGITDVRTPTADAPLIFSPSYFHRTFEWKAPRVELRPPVRLDDYVVENKLELSLRSYLDLVLANNTDISIQRLSVETFRNAILRGYSVFDPALVASFNTTRTLTPPNDVLAGAETALNQLNQPARFTYSQVLPTGTIYNVGFNTIKTSTNSSFALFNPSLNANLNVNFQQPLLRGRGSYITKLPVTIARSRLRAGEYNVQDQILRLVSVAENAYWDVVLARENLAVQEQSLALFDALLKRSQRELELGAISTLDIYQPQAQYANAEIAVTQARYRLAQVEDVLRRQMSVDLDPTVRQFPIVLTEPVTPPTEFAIDKEQSVEKALRVRPDLRSARQNLDVDDLNIRQQANFLKPDLRLTGQYGSAGRGGPFTPRSGGLNQGLIGSPVPGGWGDAYDQLFGFGFPVYGFGLTLTLPIRDRRVSADYADAVVAKRLDTLRVRSVEQTVRLDVLNAINQVENSRASIDLARISVDLAQKRADAEQKKFDLGTSTIFFVLDAQTALQRSRSDLVNTLVNYRKNLTNLSRFTGDLLEERGIAIQ